MAKSKNDPKSSQAPKISSKSPPLLKRSTKLVRKIAVDLWRTDLHAKEIGIKKQEEYMAKSRQFTRDMDIIGEIKENGKENGTIGARIREDRHRCVVKAFTGSFRWLGTIEESVSRGISQSLSADRIFPAFTLIIDDYDYLLEIEKIRGGLGFRETFHFGLILENGQMVSFSIEEKKLGIGDDWAIKNPANEEIASIDGKKLDIGGEWEISYFNEAMAENSAFVTSLILFSASRRFHGEIEKRIETYREQLRKGEPIKLQNEELDLLRNPRSMKK